LSTDHCAVARIRFARRIERDNISVDLYEQSILGNLKVVGRVLFYSTVRQGDTQTIRTYLRTAVQEFLAPRKYFPFEMTGVLLFIL
jgi:hypothetical protein